MILNWMFASAIFAALVAIAAMLAERSLASAGKARRTPWLFALGVATVWPLVAGAWFLLKPVEQPMAIIKTRIGATAARAISEQFTFAPAWSPIVQRVLIGIWIAASVLLLARIVIALARMRTVTRESEPMSMDGTDVLLSETAGPAVCGAIAPRIVLPRWILELDAPLRSIVLRHEREHVVRGDAAVVLGAALAVAVVPWSPAIWIMARRLRLAVELDCDARVLARDEDPNRYGRLLMLVAQRQTHARLQPMLAESSADLERRISEMNNATGRSRIRAVAFGAVAAGVVLLAGSSPVMAGITRPAQGKPVVSPAPAKTADTARLMTVTTKDGRKYSVALPKRTDKLAVYKAVTRDTGDRRGTKPPPPPKKDEFFEFTITRDAAQAQGSELPNYPEILKAAGIEGQVVVQFVVLTDSTVMDGSMRVLSSTHALFEAAVRSALPRLRYTPAVVDGRPVRQLIQQEFDFTIGIAPGSVESIREDTLRRNRPNRVHAAGTIRINASPVTVKKP